MTIRGRAPALILCATIAALLAALHAARPGRSIAAGPGPLTAAPGDPVIVAAGDIACDPTSSTYNGGAGTANACHQRATSDLVLGLNPAAVLALGDNQYFCGGLAALQAVYDPTWGRFKGVTHPVVGNHEYLTDGGTGCDAGNAGAAGHFAYFGAAAGQPGQGFYSFDIGAWHLIAINSNCADAGGCGSSSAQGQWLAADLAAHPGLCTLAFWHIPLFSSGGRAAANTRSVWDQLYAAGADVVLTGHDHSYERFARQTSAGARDDRVGIREFVVGTGGANHTPLDATAANSEIRDASTFGVIQLTLHPDAYDWRFRPEGGASFTDSGTETCHGRPNDTTAPTVPTGLTAAVAGPTTVNLNWMPSTDATGVARYAVERDGTLVGVSTTNAFTDATAPPDADHAYRVTAVDYNGQPSAATAPVVVRTPPDVAAPSVPGAPAASAIEATRVTLGWAPSVDDGMVVRYRVLRDGQPVGEPTSPSFVDTTVAPVTAYGYEVSAVDQSGNESGRSAPLTLTTPPLPTVLTLAAAADAHVRSDQTGVSFGGATTLEVDGSPMKRVLLRFDVQGVLGRPVRGAVLRLWCVDGATIGGVLHGVPDTGWTESVTWSTAPPASPAVVASLGGVTAGAWYQLDVTALVSGDGPVAMDLTSTSSNGADYASREGGEGQRPQLVVTTA